MTGIWIYDVLWGSTPLWISLPLTIAAVCGALWLWQNPPRGRTYY